MQINEEVLKPEMTNSQRIARSGFMRSILDIVLGVIFLVLSPFIGSVQGVLLFIAFILGAGITTMGAITIRRGNLSRGTYFAIVGNFISALAVVIFFEGLGLFALVAVVAVTALTAALGLSRRETYIAIVGSAVVGLAAVLTDLLLTDAPFRITIPAIVIPFLLAFAALITLVFGYAVLRNFRNFALRTKLITAFILVAILPLTMLGFLNERSTRNILTEEANEALFAAAQQTADSIQDFISTNLFAIGTEASLPPLVDYLSSGLSAEVQALQTLIALQAKNEVFISSYSLISRDTGRILLDTDTSNIGKVVSDETYFSETLRTGQVTLSDVVISPETGERLLYFSSPVRNEEGEILGVLSAGYKADILQNLVARSNGLVGEDSFGVLFDENLIHLAHGVSPETILTAVMPFSNDTMNELIESNRLPAVSDENQILNLPGLAYQLELAQESSDGTAFFRAEDIATGDRINQAVALDLGSPTWVLVFFQPEDVFLAPGQSQTRNTILLSIVIGSVVIGLAVAMAQLLAQPITTLRTVASQVAGGDLSAKAEISTDDEIGELASTFNSMTEQLSSLVSGLEEQVAERTRDLEQRAVQMQTAAEVARDSTQETDLDELLTSAVELISDRFSLYHVGIYLVDERSEYAVLQAASGDVGSLMLESEHRIQVGSNNAVGYVTRMGQPRVASDETETETISLTRHPLLPETRAQMVVPLSVGNRTIGSLDLHSTDPASLNEETIAIYRTMADQLAVAIQKTELLSEVGETLRELETAYGRYTSEAWQSFLQSEQSRKGYRYRQLSVEPITEASEDVQRAWLAGEIISKVSESEDVEESKLAVPMKVRGQVVGVLNLSFDDNDIPGDTREIIEDIAERLGLVLENARLLENAQQRAERERLAAEISVRMRETLDVQTILQNTAQEIRHALNLSEVSIRLANTAEPSNGHENQNEIPPVQTEDGKA
ncbi:MAG: GAF domain-containing protein [Chloroflexi bacterium]|nr:MAG: GAF domain-containing protein [Chloroflexota bacterium]MBL1194099.1 GAF domain-containing protein [Chloroflexota bacterium]NOH11393.1 GAF domain-containing protein [Chloroflexota bacterium]